MLQQIVNFVKALARTSRDAGLDAHRPKSSEDYAKDLAAEREKPKMRGH